MKSAYIYDDRLVNCSLIKIQVKCRRIFFCLQPQTTDSPQRKPNRVWEKDKKRKKNNKKGAKTKKKLKASAQARGAAAASAAAAAAAAAAASENREDKKVCTIGAATAEVS